MRDQARLEVENLGRTGVIFEGQVERQELDANPVTMPAGRQVLTVLTWHRVVTLRVLRVYRGSKMDEYTVLTGLGGGDRGFDFETGKKYLVFAYFIQGSDLQTYIGAGTSLLERAGPALRFLRGESPAPEDLLDFANYHKQFDSQWTGSLCGRVGDSDRHPESITQVFLVQAREDSMPPSWFAPRELNADGSFCVKGVPPGAYLLEAEQTSLAAPHTNFRGYFPGVIKRSEAVPIEIKAGAGVSVPQFNLREEPRFTIKIHVLAADVAALPLKDVVVRIGSPYGDPIAFAYRNANRVDANGFVSFSHVPVGHYSVTGYVLADTDPQSEEHLDPKWQQARKEIDVAGDAEATLEFAPAK